MLIVQTTLLSIVSGVVLYFAAKLYVAMLSALATKPLPASVKQIASALIYLIFIPFVAAPLLLLLTIPGVHTLTHIAWVLLLYVISIFPAMAYWHRRGRGL